MSQVPHNITKGVRKFKRPQYVSVCLTPGFKKMGLAITTHEGNTEWHPISKKLAEVLIAKGFPYEG